MDYIGAILLLILAGFVYLIPSWIAWNKRNADAIIAVNLFFGWTLIGWLIALIWSLVNDPDQQKNIVIKEVDNLDKLEKLKKLLDSGAIDERDYNTEKDKLLGKPNIIKPGNTIEF